MCPSSDQHWNTLVQYGTCTNKMIFIDWKWFKEGQQGMLLTDTTILHLLVT